MGHNMYHSLDWDRWLKDYYQSYEKLGPLSSRLGDGMYIALVLSKEMQNGTHALATGSKQDGDGYREYTFDTVDEAKVAVKGYIRGVKSYQVFIIDRQKAQIVASAGEPPKPLTWVDVTV